MNNDVPNHTATAGQLADWLTRLGSSRSEASADLLDVIHAAKQCEALIAELLTLDPTDAADVDAIAKCFGRLQAWMLGEVQVHVASFAEAWPEIDAAMEARLMSDQD